MPNREDMEEYPEVNEVDPESAELLCKMGGKDTGWPAWMPVLNPMELAIRVGGDPDLLLALLKIAQWEILTIFDS